MTHRIAVDTGGTFTDVVVADEHSQLYIFKTPSTPHDYSQGVIDGVCLAAEHFGVHLSELLSRTSHFFHGSTVATNAILQRKVGKTGYIATRGFRDTLLLREGGKPDPFNLKSPYPEPYVPRYLTVEVDERITAEGEVLRPLDEASVQAALEILRGYQVEAIAVCLIWSIANPVHERRIGEIIRAQLPGMPYTLSHELNPIIREYRRGSSTAIDASLKPIVHQYVKQLEDRLRGNGFRGDLGIFSSSGGLVSAQEMSAKPIYMLGSGPSVAPVAGLYLARTERLGENLLVTDAGGTSYDVAAIRDGNILVRKDTWIGAEYLGHITGISSVDVRSIGAGGGSIAWVDSGGLLRVGPQSAGALPGPACYQRGGTDPTVTDAAVVLGYVDPAWFLGGRMQISEESARRAIVEGVARRLGMTLEEAAAGILQVTTLEMVTAIHDITVNQGLDPRESILVAGGGAAGLNTLAIAQELGIRRVLVPRAAGAFSALGGLISDIKAEFSASQFTDSARFNYEKVNAVLHELKQRAVAFLDRMQVPDADRILEYIVEARYPYQVWELEVPFGEIPITSVVVREMEEGFHQAHDRVFGVSEPGQYIECVNWVVRAIGRGLAIQLPVEAQRPAPSEPRKVRQAYFPSRGGWIETPFYHGDDLVSGKRISGPAVILEDTSTLVVYPGCTVNVTAHHNYLVEVPAETDSSRRALPS